MFFYAISLYNTDVVMCSCLRTLKNDKTMTVSNTVLMNCEHGVHSDILVYLQSAAYKFTLCYFDRERGCARH